MVKEWSRSVAFHDAMFLKSRAGVIAQLECPLFNASKPAFKAREIKRVLLAGIDEDHWPWRLELRATAFCKDGNRRVRYRRCLRLPLQWRCNEVTVQALLGHSSSEITREVYLHSIPSDARAAVQKVEDLLTGPKRTQIEEIRNLGSSLIQ